MMKKILIACLIVAAVGILCGCGANDGFYPNLEVVGDVNQVVSFTAKDNAFPSQTIEYEGNKYQVYSLKDILVEAEPKNNDSTIYFVAADGMMASIEYANLQDNYIAFTEKGWEALNYGFPPSADIKEMKRIVVVDNSDRADYALEIAKAGVTNFTLTCGQMFISNRQIINNKEGTNEKNGNKVSVYTSNECYYIPDYLGIGANDLITVATADGKSAYYYADGYIVLNGNMLNYISADKKDTVNDIRVINIANN